MFDIECVCEGVYDLYMRENDDEHEWVYAGTFASYDEAEYEGRNLLIVAAIQAGYTL